MKKMIAPLLVLIVCLSLTACGSTTASNTQKTAARTIVPDTSSVNTQEDDRKYIAYTYNGEATDLFTIEEVDLIPQSFNSGNIALCWKVKVRNTSGEDLPMKESSMSIWYKYLDENEDELYNLYVSGGYSETIKDGKAIWLEQLATPASWSRADIENVAYIEIYGYSNTLHSSPDYEFKNYITIDVREFFDWDDIA